MTVHFKRSGGILGRTISATLSEPLPDDVRRHVEAARFFDLPKGSSDSRRGADRFQYAITVSEGGREHTVVVTDGNIPESLQPLIDDLTRAATAKGSRGSG
jgi:hypothetical protein